MSMNFQSLKSKIQSLKYYYFLPYPFYFILVVENIGVEPMTSCVQGRRSSQLS